MKHPSILPLFLLLTSLTTAGCGGDAADTAADSSGTLVRMESAEEPYGLTAPAAAPPPAVGQDGGAPAAPREMTSADTAGFVAGEPGVVPGMAAVSLNPMLVRTGRAVVQVDSLEEGIARVRALARRVGGIVGNTTISAGTDETRRAEMELRIPSARFDEAVTSLSPIGQVRSVNATAEDVGEEYTDVYARVANARRLEARLLDLLQNRTGRLEEVLHVEREVARVRGEIEQYEGRLRYLSSRASVSTLAITLHEPQAVMSGRPGARPIRDAFGTAWRSFIGLVAGLIASLGLLLPLGFLAFVGWRLFRWMGRRERARDAAYREALRRERERAPAPEHEEPPVSV